MRATFSYTTNYYLYCVHSLSASIGVHSDFDFALCLWIFKSPSLLSCSNREGVTVVVTPLKCCLPTGFSVAVHILVLSLFLWELTGNRALFIWHWGARIPLRGTDLVSTKKYAVSFQFSALIGQCLYQEFTKWTIC